MFEDGCYSYRGMASSDLFNNSLEKFTKIYCICERCKVPELILNVEKQKITSKCKACGYDNIIKGNKKIKETFFLAL